MTIDDKKTAKLLRDVVGGDPRVIEFANEDESLSVHVFIAKDRPQLGVTTYATVDASRFDTNVKTEDDRRISVEFIAECQSNFPAMGNAVANCALNIADGSYLVEPDAILPNVIAASDDNVPMKHCMLAIPFSWPDLPTSVDEGDEVLAFLQLVPVSQSEIDFAYEHGTAALRERIQDSEADILHIERPSVV